MDITTDRSAAAPQRATDEPQLLADEPLVPPKPAAPRS